MAKSMWHTSNNRCTNGGASDVLGALGGCGNLKGLFDELGSAGNEGGVLLFVFSSGIFSIAFKNALGSWGYGFSKFVNFYDTTYNVITRLTSILFQC